MIGKYLTCLAFMAILTQMIGCKTFESWQTTANYTPTSRDHKVSNFVDQKITTWPEVLFQEWYEPEKISSNEEAKANIKNLQNSIFFETMNATDIDVDKYGMRAKLQWDEEHYETLRSTSFGDNSVYGRGIFSWFTSSSTNTTFQTYKETLKKTKTVIIPFNDVSYISYGTDAGIDKTIIYVYLKDGSVIRIGASKEYDSKKFADSLYTLSMSSFGNNLNNTVGILGLADLTEDEKNQIHEKNGAVVTGIERDGPAWKAGIGGNAVITEINNTMVTNAKDATDFLLNALNSKTISVKFIQPPGYAMSSDNRATTSDPIFSITTIKPKKR